MRTAASRPARLRPLAGEGCAYLLAALPGRSAGGHTLIFAQGRSGSTLLESLLDSTGHFIAKGEVLGQEGSKIRHPQEFLRGAARRWPHRNYLCHVKIYHLTRDRLQAGRRPVEPRAFLHRLADDGWRIVWLRRRDRVRQALSNIVAEMRGDYHKLDDRPEDHCVYVSHERLKAMVAQRREFEAQEREALAGLNYHEVVYERDLEDAARHQHTVDAILDFLALPQRPVSTPLRKVNARPLQELVANYREFAGWIEELQPQVPPPRDVKLPLRLATRTSERRRA